MEGEGLGDLVTCNDVRQTEGRQMGDGARLLQPQVFLRLTISQDRQRGEYGQKPESVKKAWELTHKKDIRLCLLYVCSPLGACCHGNIHDR